MTMRTYRVEGMTCGHCARAVEREVSGLEGVDGARVDLSAETVSVESPAEIHEQRIADAVAEAGYTLAGRA